MFRDHPPVGRIRVGRALSHGLSGSLGTLNSNGGDGVKSSQTWGFQPHWGHSEIFFAAR